MTKHAIPDSALDGDIAILGRKGKGKSIVAKGIVERLLDKKRRVITLDPMGNWWGLKARADGSPGYPVAVFGGSHADIPINETSGRKLAGVLAREHIPAVVDVGSMRKSEMLRFTEEFLDELYAKNRDPLWLVLEEADVFAPQNPMKGTERLLNEVDRIARRGRAFGFRLITLTQRPARLHKDVMSQAATLVAMGVSSPQDRDAIKAWVEGNADRDQSKVVFESLAKLGTGEGWVWDTDAATLERVKFPMIKTLDTSATPKAGERRIEPKKLASADIAKLTALLQPPAPAPAEAKGSPVAKMQAMARKQAAAPIDAQKLKAAEERGYKVGFTECATSANKIIASTRRLLAQLQKSHRTHDEQIGQLLESMPGEVPVLVETRRLASVVKARAAVVPADGSPPRILQFSKGETSDGVSAPQQRILNALAWAETIGASSVEKSQLGLLAEASPTSSTFTNNLGALRTGLLLDYPRPGYVALTDMGRTRAQPQERPPSLSALHEAIKRRLSGPQGRILDAAIEAYPDSLDKGELAEATEASATSSTYTNNLGRLRTLGLIDYPAPGRVQATKLLFPEGLS